MSAGRDARVERDKHGTREWHGIMRGEQDVRVAGEDRDPVARVTPSAFSAPAKLQRPSQEFGVGERRSPSTTPTRSPNTCAARHRKAVGVSGW